MPLPIAVLRLDESSTGWLLSYDNESGNSEYRILPLKLLIEENGQNIKHIGNMAISVYEELKKKSTDTGYFFFPNIVTALEKKLEKNVDENRVFIEDITGKSLLAIDVFAMTIKLLKYDIKRDQNITDEDWILLEKDLYYVIVVPALLQEKRVHNLITKATLQAGIKSNMVSVVTDIVTASLICRDINSTCSTCDENTIFVRFGVDTTDILKCGTLQSVSIVKSFQYGLKVCEQSFETFVSKIFQKDVFEAFKASHPSDYIGIKNDIGLKIKSCLEDGKERITLRIPFNLIHMYERRTGGKINETICKFADLQIIGDKLRLPLSLCLGMDIFRKPNSGVLSHIKVVLETQNINRIIVFGQLAQSPIIQKELKSICQGVIVLREADILSGASITGRRYRSTTGQPQFAPTHLIVAAIDIGTTYSGWAYQFYEDLKSDSTPIYGRTWSDGSILTDKTPTCLLVKPDGKTVQAFGYDAENKYRDLIEDKSHSTYYFFRGFKMLLYRKLSEKIHRTIMIEDEMGKTLPAIDVFSMSIRFMVEDFLEVCKNRVTGDKITTQDILWVLTVPAIWNDGPKQFMREAAVKAGIENKRLTIALEPEAASIYCRRQKIKASTNERMGKDVSCLEQGKRYMVIDAGGGTVDITVHEVGTDDSIKEVHAACGGRWGGTEVDKEFNAVLLELLGKQILKQFKNEHIDDYLDLWRGFEYKKRKFEPSNSRATILTIPLSLLEIFKDSTHEDLKKAITKTQYVNEIKLQRNKMEISANLMWSMFNRTINSIIPFVEKIKKRIDIAAILMVGGYSECIVFQEAVKISFPRIDVIVPIEVSSSIMKGAVMFGYKPTIISKRVLRYTYGIRSSVKFIKGKHPEDKRLHTDAGEICTKIFSKHVEKDQEVNFCESQVRLIYTPVFKAQKQMEVSVYASEKANPVYTDKDCHFVGKMIIALSEADTLEKKIEVALSFSHTEIVVAAKAKDTGKETHAAFDFLF